MIELSLLLRKPLVPLPLPDPPSSEDPPVDLRFSSRPAGPSSAAPGVTLPLLPGRAEESRELSPLPLPPPPMMDFGLLKDMPSPLLPLLVPLSVVGRSSSGVGGVVVMVKKAGILIPPPGVPLPLPLPPEVGCRNERRDRDEATELLLLVALRGGPGMSAETTDAPETLARLLALAVWRRLSCC